LRRLIGDLRAVTAIEYSLIVFLIGTAGIGAMTTVGQNVMDMLGSAASALL
jgi:Flp pilus assembly pilin Flp